MEELPIIIIFLFVVSSVFMLLGRYSRTTSDEEGASANYTIGFMLLIIVVLLMGVFLASNMNFQEIEPSEPGENVVSPPAP